MLPRAWQLKALTESEVTRLITAMETAGRSLESRELEEAMRERRLGAPATRAAIIETFLARGHVERQGAH
jgi:DNA topoisomerase-3